MDVYHIIGNDIQLDSTNDLQLVFDTNETNQRIMRRLFTNKGGYIWNSKWGASIPWKIGEPFSQEVYQDIIKEVKAAVLEDDDVAKDPPPVIQIETVFNGIICYIRYYNLASNEHDTVSLRMS